MIEKSKYMDKLERIESIFKKYNFLEANIAQVKSLKESVEDFAFRVVLVGGFSSGKSALLNRLIGQELFKEDLGPETALPAEVSWAPVESAYAVYSDGTTKEVEVTTATKEPPANASCLIFHVDNPFLKARPELILVDFPGFDSNVEGHNKAIANYLQKGSAFILLVPAKNGTLGKSDIKFLKEAVDYPQGLACFISKSDHVIPEKCADIAKYVQGGIRAIYGREVPVIPISSRTDSVDDFERSVGSIIDKFEPQTLFEASLSPHINRQLDIGIAALEEYLAASKLDVRDIDNKIDNAKEMKENLSKELEKERRKLDNKYRNEIIPGIMNKLDSALRGNVDMLADALVLGEQRFADAAQGIVRPILASVPGEIEANLRGVVSDMHMEQGVGGDSNNNENMKKALLDIVNVISTSIPTAGGRGTGTPTKPDATNPNTVTGPRAGNMLSGLGSGLLVAEMFNPILGIVVGLAPALIEIFFNCNNKPQQDPKAQAIAQVQSQAIPAILSRLESQIGPSVLETRDMMFNEIKKKIDENMKISAEAMEQAKKEKEKLEADHKNLMDEIKTDINELANMSL